MLFLGLTINTNEIKRLNCTLYLNSRTLMNTTVEQGRLFFDILTRLGQNKTNHNSIITI